MQPLVEELHRMERSSGPSQRPRRDVSEQIQLAPPQSGSEDNSKAGWSLSATAGAAAGTAAVVAGGVAAAEAVAGLGAAAASVPTDSVPLLDMSASTSSLVEPSLQVVETDLDDVSLWDAAEEELTAAAEQTSLTSIPESLKTTWRQWIEDECRQGMIKEGVKNRFTESLNRPEALNAARTSWFRRYGTEPTDAEVLQRLLEDIIRS
ncbi:hypothetical protein [Wheat umbra-like virus]|nr:hypothetical protein [Wheat umbra-like virus]